MVSLEYNISLHNVKRLEIHDFLPTFVLLLFVIVKNLFNKNDILHRQPNSSQQLYVGKTQFSTDVLSGR
jgi:hypothetical protein